MAYTNFQNCTLQEYKDIIYSQSETNNLKILFNGIDYPNIGEKCEKLEITSRIMPDDGKKILYLDNFIAKEATLTLHDVDLEDITDPVTIYIGTIVDEENQTYEYVPLGIFNIQDTPTNDKGKITVKLRDNAVKFDFKYNAEPLITEHGGTATLMEILEDICDKANVTCNVSSFTGQDIEIGIYDNTVNGRTYVSYIAEQAGMIPTINRNGQLIFIDLSNLYTWQIPLDILEKYEKGESFNIERVVYESGIIKYETSQDETLSTLYLDAVNPYVSNVSQVESILELLSSFEIDTVKTGKVLGNPAIDPYDLIQVIDTDNSNEVIFTTLANNKYTFKGNNRQEFSTEIGKEERKENVTNTGEPVFRKWAKTEIDNVNAEILIQAGRVDALEESIEVLSVSVDSNLLIVSVDSTNTPFTTKTYTINHSSKYLGEPITITPTTTDEYTGITCTITNSAINFAVSNQTAIQNDDNKYVFTWSYTDAGGNTHTTTRTIMLSTLKSEVEQNVVISNERPTNTNVLWYYIEEHKLLRYDANDEDWVEANDFDVKIDNVTNLITGTDGINTQITNLNERLRQAEDDLSNKIDSSTYDQLETRVSTIQTNTYTKTEIQQIATGEGVDGVVVSAIVSTEATFDKNGMHYQKSTEDTTSTINEKGLQVDDKQGNELLFAGVRADSSESIVETENLTTRTYLVFANGKGRFEKFTDTVDNIEGVGLFLQ